MQPVTSQSGVAGGDPEPRPSRSLSPAAFAASSAIATPVGRALDPHPAVDQLEVGPAPPRARSAASSSSWSRTSLAASITARPLLKVVCDP